LNRGGCIPDCPCSAQPAIACGFILTAMPHRAEARSVIMDSSRIRAAVANDNQEQEPARSGHGVQAGAMHDPPATVHEPLAPS